MPRSKSKSKKESPNVHDIEESLKDGLVGLEHDLHRLAMKYKKHFTETLLNADSTALAELLETRLQQAFAYVMNLAATTPVDRTELAFLKNLAGPLSEILSFDFLKNVLSRLSLDFGGDDVDEFGMDTVLVEQIKPFFDFLYYKYWRVKTTGIENIPATGKALLVGNHSGTLPYDGAMLAAAIHNEHPSGRVARFLVENFVYHMPVLGSLMYRIGGIRACPENAERLLNKDHLVIVFPEGVKGIGKYYKDRYKLQRFGRGGFIKLCIKTQAPLIPVGIVGAEEIHPILFKSNILAKTLGVPYIPVTPTFPLFGILGLIPFPSQWAIHFGKPISFDAYSKETLTQEITIHKLSEMVRGEIQGILDELLKKKSGKP